MFHTRFLRRDLPESFIAVALNDGHLGKMIRCAPLVAKPSTILPPRPSTQGRKKKRKYTQEASLRALHFTNIFYVPVSAEADTDALPDFLAAVEESYMQRQQRNIAKAITPSQFRYPDAGLTEVPQAEQRGINLR